MLALEPHAAVDGGELLAFTDADALRALDVITKRRPILVALERGFAATPRGAALISRIQADPTLAQSEIRVVSPDMAVARMGGATVDPEAVSTITMIEPTPEGATLDKSGTRVTARVRMAKGVEVLVDGNPTTLVDLSIGGAQLLSSAVLRPNQRVRMTLSDEHGTWRMSATIAWASFEIPARYRAGAEFVDADSAVIQSYSIRHQA